jgi:hypothetical protein
MENNEEGGRKPDRQQQARGEGGSNEAMGSNGEGEREKADK